MKNRLFELRKVHPVKYDELAKAIHFLQQVTGRYETVKINFSDFFTYLRYKSNIRNEVKYSKTLHKVSMLIERFYHGIKKVNCL